MKFFQAAGDSLTAPQDISGCLAFLTSQKSAASRISAAKYFSSSNHVVPRMILSSEPLVPPNPPHLTCCLEVRLHIVVPRYAVIHAMHGPHCSSYRNMEQAEERPNRWCDGTIPQHQPIIGKHEFVIRREGLDASAGTSRKYR